MTDQPGGGHTEVHRFMPSDDDAERAVASLLATLDLQPVGTDAAGLELFVGPSQPTHRGRVFGGQVLGQSVRAMAFTVPERVPIHSMHAYFLRPGDPSKPITFSVERLRDGRSFLARRVQALQDGQPILSSIASFQTPDEQALEHQLPMPEVPAPEDLPSFAETVADVSHPAARFIAQTRAFDLRHVLPPVMVSPDPDARGWNSVWMKPLRPLVPPADDHGPDGQPLLQKHLPHQHLPHQHLHSALLAYASDYTLLEPVLRRHGLAWATPMKVASLDHAMWWHRPVSVDQWLLYTQWSPSAGGGRGLGAGRIYTRDGELVASVAQEGMVRPLPNRPA